MSNTAVHTHDVMQLTAVGGENRMSSNRERERDRNPESRCIYKWSFNIIITSLDEQTTHIIELRVVHTRDIYIIRVQSVPSIWHHFSLSRCMRTIICICQSMSD